MEDHLAAGCSYNIRVDLLLGHQVVEHSGCTANLSPSSTPITDTFFAELSNYLEVVALYKCQIIVAGDLNIHVERGASDLHAVKLHELLDSFDCMQHVPHIPTHQDGGTLDLVITKSEQQVQDLSVQPSNAVSDHSVITWSVDFPYLPPIAEKRDIRSWARLDRDKFRTAILSSELGSSR